MLNEKHRIRMRWSCPALLSWTCQTCVWLYMQSRRKQLSNVSIHRHVHCQGCWRHLFNGRRFVPTRSIPLRPNGSSRENEETDVQTCTRTLCIGVNEFDLEWSLNSFSFFVCCSWEVYRLKKGRVRQQHSGQIFGFTSCLARFPRDNACIIFLSNLEETSVDDVLEKLTDLLFE